MNTSTERRIRSIDDIGKDPPGRINFHCDAEAFATTIRRVGTSLNRRRSPCQRPASHRHTIVLLDDRYLTHRRPLRLPRMTIQR